MHVALVGAEFEENLAIRYLWGALEAEGHRVTQVVFNGRAELELAAQELASSGAEVAGFSMVFTSRGREFAALAQRVRELGFAGHIVAGGHFAGFYADELLRDVPAIDSVALGEGESILCKLVAMLDDLSTVQGLVWRDGGRIVHNAPALKPPDLDVLPWPPRKSPLDSYLGMAVTNILSSRGCSHSCAFCSIAAWHKLCGGPRVRMRSVDHVADEMADLYRRGVRIFNFHDDNFLPARRAERFARVRALKAALETRGMGRIAFAIKARPDAMEDELLELLLSMGLFRVFLGIEAGTPEALAELGRKQKVEDNICALETVNRLGIHCCFNLLVLNPSSTLQDLSANVAFLRSHPRNPMNFCRTEIYAGTPLELRLRAEGRLLGDYWSHDYRIADPAAQVAFEVIFPCFEQRNFGAEGLHHLAMQVDYEHQLRAHFFGANEELGCKCKRYVVAVNLNTVEHLEAIIAEIERSLPDAAARRALVEKHRALVEADNDRLKLAGRALLDEIRAQVAPLAQPSARPARRNWARAAAAGFAASLAVAAACKTQTQVAEMAPPPPPLTDGGPPNWTQVAEMAPPPPPPPPPEVRDAGMPLQILREDPGNTYMTEMVARPPQPPDDGGLGPAGLLPLPLQQRALTIVARYVSPQDVELELWFDGRGAVSRIALRAQHVEPAVVRNAGQALGALTTTDPDVRNGHFVLKFSEAEVRSATRHEPTQVSERAPMPPPPPPPTSHPRESAPRPPRPPRSEFSEMAPAPNSAGQGQPGADGSATGNGSASDVSADDGKPDKK